MTDTIALANAAFAAFGHADWHGLLHGPSVVYLLAHARRDAFYIDVASDLSAVAKQCRHLVEQQEATLPRPQVMPLLLVWFEVHDDSAAARARATEIRHWTHAWQRRLVETLNPHWLDVYGYAYGFPGKLPQVGEHRARQSNLPNPFEKQPTEPVRRAGHLSRPTVSTRQHRPGVHVHHPALAPSAPNSVCSRDRRTGERMSPRGIA
ncbi:endonuclease [Xanthomonas axonopodis pv. poinsettiicola]|uniref:endonuclease n=1 Tax=Xanthomonas TaxID=338 RepID=UPI001E526C08|nr:endonuclease [Xanthomonas codiaei]MCC8536165.1 endonuclease [Xanthomonas codiaei]